MSRQATREEPAIGERGHVTGDASATDRPRSSWAELRAWLFTVSVAPLLVALVVLDIADRPVRRWFDEHEFTTSALTGLLLLLITVLIVNRVLRVRQLRERAQVTAAQAAIIVSQARRVAQLVRLAADDAAEWETASEEMRTYLTMLLISSPVLIEARESRRFLEAAQRLAAVLSRVLKTTAEGPLTRELDARLTEVTEQVRASVEPLLARLATAQRVAVEAGVAAVGGEDASASSEHERT